jgi:hypothetical protein
MGLRADDGDEGIAALTIEVPVDLVAGLDGLRSIGLPAPAGQRVLGARSQDAEAYGDDDPRDHDPAAVRCRPEC